MEDRTYFALSKSFTVLLSKNIVYACVIERAPEIGMPFVDSDVVLEQYNLYLFIPERNRIFYYK